jgi:CGNR zinc finger/Putative stress-induced transcription regulator
MTEQAAPGDRQVQASAAPGELEAVRAFVNTLDIEQGTDDFATAAGFGWWLSGQGLLATPGAVSAADLASAVALREALRGVLREHAGHPGYPGLAAGPAGPAGPAGVSAVGAGPAGELRAVAAGLPVSLGVDDDGTIAAVPAVTGARGALARLLLIAAAAAANGTWARLKACTADDCQWAFYDRSPTRNGRWCTMSICGSRAKSRAYRRRAQESRAEGVGQPWWR